MRITGMNHAVPYLSDARRHAKFYADVLGFEQVIAGPLDLPAERERFAAVGLS